MQMNCDKKIDDQRLRKKSFSLIVKVKNIYGWDSG